MQNDPQSGDTKTTYDSAVDSHIVLVNEAIDPACFSLTACSSSSTSLGAAPVSVPSSSQSMVSLPPAISALSAGAATYRVSGLDGHSDDVSSVCFIVPSNGWTGGTVCVAPSILQAAIASYSAGKPEGFTTQCDTDHPFAA